MESVPTELIRIFIYHIVVNLIMLSVTNKSVVLLDPPIQSVILRDIHRQQTV